MADVYEKDLAAKSSLTSSDYIRVVGSDNVSYKQPMNSVLNVFNLVFSSASDMDAKLANLPQSHAYTFFSGNNEVLTIFGTGSSSVRGIVVKPTSTLADFTLWTGVTPTKMYTFRMTLSTHAITYFTEWPTRAEVAALASDSGWIELTTNVKYRKVGKICYVNIDGYTATQTSGAETIGTLPEGYRPTITAQWCGRKGASTLLGGWVTSAGLIRYTAVSASGTIATFITFPVG